MAALESIFAGTPSEFVKRVPGCAFSQRVFLRRHSKTEMYPSAIHQSCVTEAGGGRPASKSALITVVCPCSAAAIRALLPSSSCDANARRNSRWRLICTNPDAVSIEAPHLGMRLSPTLQKRTNAGDVASSGSLSEVRSKVGHLEIKCCRC